MSDVWTPVLLVLVLGVLVGLVLAWRLRRDVAAPAADGALRLEDLERRRDVLYRRLAASDSEADRQILEQQAARVLRDIDRLTGGRSEVEVAVAPSSAARQPARTGRPMLIGFVGGAAMVTLVGALVWLALGDARPRQESEARAAPSSSVPGEHPAAPISAEAAERLDTLRRRAAADPGDLVARKQLALALLAAEQYFEAFRITDEILRARPDDPDGLYVQGMVRLTMGQDDEAMALLERVLERYPNHVLALAGRGMIFMRGGDVEAARLTWERALAAAGGQHPDLEELIAMTGRVAPGAPPAATRQATEPEPAPAGSFTVRLQLAPGVGVPAGATLFVFLRQGESGPPAAVKRIADPRFPLEVTLGPADSMLGRPLPSSGVITARLDADGSASTRDEGDLTVSGGVDSGDVLSLILGSS